MSHYLDTSVLAAYYCPEALSDKVEAFLAACERPVISSLTECELCSAVAGKIRSGDLDKGDADRLVAQFLSHIDGGYYTSLFPDAESFRLARNWLASWSTSLRTLDALHLAIARSENLIVVTADRQMAAAARMLSLELLLIE